MYDIQYGKVIRTSNVVDGIETPAAESKEVSLYSSHESLVKDLIEALKPLNTGATKKLELCIQLDSKNRLRIVKKWTVKLL